jgi:uncharacterized damage-inducible protein DinB
MEGKHDSGLPKPGLLEPEMPEPWLRGTLTDVDAVRRQVLHALELACEDVTRWCAFLSDEEINARPYGLASVAFHLRHIARSLDRLLTYAEGQQLSGGQMDALRSELAPGAIAEVVVAEVRAGLGEAERRIRLISPRHYEEPRGVGRRALPSSVGGLLIHCAEHTQRHAGQAVTTAKVVVGMRGA